MKKRSVLITGSARRIGRETALFLASLGFDIALHYSTSKEAAEDTAIKIRSMNVDCLVYQADLQQKASVLDLIPRVKKDFPNLSLLINNASTFNKAMITETEWELFENHMAINFRAPFFLSRAYALNFSSGHIINILDTKINNNSSLYSSYTLSKKVLAEFTKMAALEFAPSIRVNGLAPGFILLPENHEEGYEKILLRKIPLKKQGEIKNLLDSIGFLLHNEYLTGQIVYVDGGQGL